MYSSHSSELSNLDLNLLIVFHALYETRSTTRAAELVGRSQPAVSLSLRRLRDIFSDSLFYRSGKSLDLTPLAKELEAPVRQIMAETAGLFERKTQFSPELSEKQITLAFPENAIHLASSLQKAIKQQAPRMSVIIRTLTLAETDYDWGANALISGEIDFLLSFYRSTAKRGLELRRLDSQHWMVVHSSNENISTYTLEDWIEKQHILVTSGTSGRSPVDDILSAQGLYRKIGMRTTSFFQALYAVYETDMVFNTMCPVIEPVASAMGLQLSKPPITLPDVSMCFLVRDTKMDPSSRWLALCAEKLFQENCEIPPDNSN